MKSASKIFLMILINIIVSVCAALATLYWWENIRGGEVPFSVNAILSSNEIVPTSASAVTPIEPLGISTGNNQLREPIETAIALPTAVSTGMVLADVLNAGTPTPEAFIPVTRDRLVSVVSVYGMGDLNSETVRIQSNADDVVVMDGWTIEDAEKNIYTFPNIQLIRKGVFVELYTRSGHTTPFELYWGQSEARWQSGETVVLKDSTGQLQATYRIP